MQYYRICFLPQERFEAAQERADLSAGELEVGELRGHKECNSKTHVECRARARATHVISGIV